MRLPTAPRRARRSHHYLGLIHHHRQLAEASLPHPACAYLVVSMPYGVPALAPSFFQRMRARSAIAWVDGHLNRAQRIRPPGGSVLRQTADSRAVAGGLGGQTLPRGLHPRPVDRKVGKGVKVLSQSKGGALLLSVRGTCSRLFHRESTGIDRFHGILWSWQDQRSSDSCVRPSCHSSTAVAS